MPASSPPETATSGPAAPENLDPPVAELRRRIAVMTARNAVYKSLAVEVVDIAPRQGVFAMTVRPDHANGADACHGGVVFTFADIAMAMVAISLRGRAVTAGAQIEFLAPARIGARLLARSTETYCEGRTGHYDVRLTDDAGTTIALLRGRMRFLGGPAW